MVAQIEMMQSVPNFFPICSILSDSNFIKALLLKPCRRMIVG